jgi:hypothetical protein
MKVSVPLTRTGTLLNAVEQAAQGLNLVIWLRLPALMEDERVLC